MNPSTASPLSALRADLSKSGALRPLWERILDYGISALVLVALLPLILVAFVLIKVISPGPVIFKQRRIGFNGEPFMIYKLRTMRLGAKTETHESHAVELIKKNRTLTKMDAMGDSRLIPFGRFLRASGIDELPQLVNVLKGEMSLVGPRPCVPAETEAFSPLDRRRFAALPGITGLWQVSGKNALTFSEMIDCDIQYTMRKGPKMYLSIAFKTPFVLIQQVLNSRESAATAQLPGNTEANLPSRIAS